MHKHLYKSARVVFNGHLKQYDVEYKKWWKPFWTFDSCYKYDEDKRYPIHYSSKEQAEKRAVERAQGLLETTEVWKQTNAVYFI